MASDPSEPPVAGETPLSGPVRKQRKFARTPNKNPLVQIPLPPGGRARGVQGHKVQRIKGHKACHLLFHARLYIFADCFGGIPLRALSWNGLHPALVDVEAAGAFSGLIRVAKLFRHSLMPVESGELFDVVTACDIERRWPVLEVLDSLETQGEFGSARPTGRSIEKMSHAKCCMLQRVIIVVLSDKPSAYVL